MQDLIDRIRKDNEIVRFSEILIYDKLIDVLVYLARL